MAALVDRYNAQGLLGQVGRDEIPDVTTRTEAMDKDDTVARIRRPRLLEMQPQTANFDERHPANDSRAPSPPSGGSSSARGVADYLCTTSR